jgi:hypothetical protein
MRYRYLICDPCNGLVSGTNSVEFAKRINAEYEHSIYDVATGLWMDRDGFFYEEDNPLEDAALDFPDLAD